MVQRSVHTLMASGVVPRQPGMLALTGSRAATRGRAGAGSAAVIPRRIVAVVRGATVVARVIVASVVVVAVALVVAFGLFIAGKFGRARFVSFFLHFVRLAEHFYRRVNRDFSLRGGADLFGQHQSS